MTEAELNLIAALTRAVTGHFIAIDISGPHSPEALAARLELEAARLAVTEIVCRYVDARDGAASFGYDGIP